MPTIPNSATSLPATALESGRELAAALAAASIALSVAELRQSEFAEVHEALVTSGQAERMGAGYSLYLRNLEADVAEVLATAGGGLGGCYLVPGRGYTVEGE